MSNLTTPAERLRHARILAGYATAKAFAASHDVPQPTYALHEKGGRKLSPEVAERYAADLGCSAAWLLTGEGEEPEDQTRNIIPRRLTILELDVRAAAGAGGLTDSDVLPEVVDKWQLPSEFLRAQTTAPAGELRVIRVYGDSMIPIFNPGDRVLVDVSDKLPSPPGIFVLWDGLGVVIKRVEHIPYSDPPLIRLVSANSAYGNYDKPLAEVAISGRVIGKWQWT